MTEEATEPTTIARVELDAAPVLHLKEVAQLEEMQTYRKFAAQLMMKQDLWDGFMLRCDAIAKTRLYGHKTSDTVMIAGLKGFEMGWSLMQALERIKVIHGTPTIRGPSAVAMIRSHGFKMDCVIQTAERSQWYCERPGYEPRTYNYERSEAEHAGLPGRNDNWTKYPIECCKWAGAARAAKDLYTDLLGGFEITEAVTAGLGPQPGSPDEPKEEKRNVRREENQALLKLTQASLVADGRTHQDTPLGGEAYNERKAKLYTEATKRAEVQITGEPTDEQRERLITAMGAMLKDFGGTEEGS